MNRVVAPEYFSDPTVGRPIANGSIYIGEPDKAPQNFPKQVSVQQENGTIVAIAQPVSTNAGGQAQYLGSPVTLLVSGDYSIQILNSLGVQANLIPNVATLTENITVDDMLALINVAGQSDGDTVDMLGYFVTFPQDAFKGSGSFAWQDALNKNQANGGTIIDPDNIGAFDGTSSTINALLAAQGAGVGTGCWVRLDSGPLSSSSYGSFDGDITEVLKSFALDPALNKIGAGGTFSVTEDVDFLIGEDSIHFEDDVNITANGTYTDAVINIGSNVTALIGTLVAQLDAGDKVIPFAGLTRGDLIAVWNPADGSYLNFLATYRQGEFAIVSADSAGGNTSIDGQLFDTYPIGSKVFKLTTDQTAKKVSGRVNFTSTAYATRIGLAIRQAKYVDVTGLQVSVDESTHCLQFRRCFQVSGIDVVARQSGSTTSGLDYGLVVTNCQHMDVEGYFHAERHGSTTGGDSEDASIVNRWIKIRGVVSTTGQGLVPGADWHGNTEHCEYGGRLVGLKVAGHKTKITPGSTIEPIPGVEASTVLCAELKSFDHDLSNITVLAHLDPYATTTKGVVDCGGVSGAMTADTVLDGIFRLTNSKIIAPIAQVPIIVKNRGSTANFDMDVSGLQMDCPLAAVSAILMAKVSGNDMRRIYMPGYFDPDKNPVSLDNGTLVNGLEETGTQRSYIGITNTEAGATITYTAPDTISDSANGFGSFESGMTIVLTGSTSNDGTYVIDTAAAGALTLIEQTITTEASSTASVIVAGGALAAFTLFPVVFREVFPFPPKVLPQYEGGYIGTKLPQATPESVTTTGFNMVLQTYDASTFSAALAKNIYWKASLND